MIAKLAPIVGAGGRAPNLRSNRVEQWHADTLDGLWSIDRLEDAATTWEVTHVSGFPGGSCYGSMRRARAAIAAGHALKTARAAVVAVFLETGATLTEVQVDRVLERVRPNRRNHNGGRFVGEVYFPPGPTSLVDAIRAALVG